VGIAAGRIDGALWVEIHPPLKAAMMATLVTATPASAALNADRSSRFHSTTRGRNIGRVLTHVSPVSARPGRNRVRLRPDSWDVSSGKPSFVTEAAFIKRLHLMRRSRKVFQQATPRVWRKHDSKPMKLHCFSNTTPEQITAPACKPFPPSSRTGHVRARECRRSDHRSPR